MSKRELKSYLHDLSKEQLQEQIIDLYTRFKPVKEYYDFAFNPKEEKLTQQSRVKIAKEYFPVNGRRAKMRRSVAQKIIRHFRLLGVDAPIVADTMLYNIEIAQTYSSQKEIKQASFYASMLKSYQEAVSYINENGLKNEFDNRLEKIAQEAEEQNWINCGAFGAVEKS